MMHGGDWQKGALAVPCYELIHSFSVNFLKFPIGRGIDE